MRILVVAACPLPWPRGTPIRIHRMAEALKSQGHEVHLATYPLGDETTSVSYQLHRAAGAGTRVDPQPGPSVKKALVLDPLLYKRVKTLLESQTFDVVHAHHYEGLLISLCARRRVDTPHVPIVYDAHTLLASELPSYRLGIPRALAGRIGRALDLRLPCRADHVIAVTDRMRRWFVSEALIREDRVSLISNGIEEEHFEQAPSEADDRDAGPRIVYAGNLAAYQGIELLLQAMRAIRSVSPDARLTLITDSALGRLQGQIESLGLEGSVSVVRADYATLPMHLARADVLVNPRVECDGIPQKLLNYMASGRPIVSFVGSSEGLENERTALLVAGGDVKAFADAVLRLLGHRELGVSIGDAARRKIVAQRGWAQVAREVERVYAHVLDARVAASPRA